MNMLQIIVEIDHEHHMDWQINDREGAVEEISDSVTEMVRQIVEHSRGRFYLSKPE